jgi:hypothetical protein
MISETMTGSASMSAAEVGSDMFAIISLKPAGMRTPYQLEKSNP